MLLSGLFLVLVIPVKVFAVGPTRIAYSDAAQAIIDRMIELSLERSAWRDAAQITDQAKDRVQRLIMDIQRLTTSTTDEKVIDEVHKWLVQNQGAYSALMLSRWNVNWAEP